MKATIVVGTRSGKEFSSIPGEYNQQEEDELVRSAGDLKKLKCMSIPIKSHNSNDATDTVIYFHPDDISYIKLVIEK
jgi:hypothetical protein